MSASILMVEDNVRLASNLKTGLTEHGYTVAVARNGKTALSIIEQEAFDIVLLDLGLPDLDGNELIPEIRKHHPHAAILITSARDSVEDRIQGLQLGSDDYLTKPISFPELLARIEAIQRRIQNTPSNTLVRGPVRINTRDRRAWIHDQEELLPPREFDLLAYFMENPEKIINRSMLAKNVWRVNDRMVSLDNTIDVYISRLREHLKPCADSVSIKTIRGIGFQWAETEP